MAAPLLIQLPAQDLGKPAEDDSAFVLLSLLGDSDKLLPFSLDLAQPRLLWLSGW